MDDALFRLILTAELVITIVIRLPYRTRSAVLRPRFRYKDSILLSFIYTALGLSSLLAMIIHLSAPAWMIWSSLALPVWSRWTGVLVAAVALVLLWWVHDALGANFSTAVSIYEHHTLITSGPYKWVRHPMYSVFYMIAISYFLLSANWVVGICWLASLTFMVITRVPREELALLQRFGAQYSLYMEKTGRFLPRISI